MPLTPRTRPWAKATPREREQPADLRAHWQWITGQLVLRAPLTLIALAGLATIKDVAYPAGAIQSRVNGRDIRLSVGVPDPISLGKELPGMPRLLPCSVRVNIDTGFADSYGIDGLMTWTAAHEVGHCMEKLLPGGRSTLSVPPSEWMTGWTARTAASETYADAWASLYLARCGIDMAPLGWPDQLPPETPVPSPALKAARLREAQRCLPRPEEAQRVSNPVITMMEVRRLGRLDLAGQPQQHPVRSPAWHAYSARMSREVGVNPARRPPASFREAGERAARWLAAQPESSRTPLASVIPGGVWRGLQAQIPHTPTP